MRELFFRGRRKSFSQNMFAAREDKFNLENLLEDGGMKNREREPFLRTRSGWRALYARRVRHWCHGNLQLKEVRT